MIVRADLHVHSCLSPCGDLSMSPSRIAREAASQGIGLLALTDHNTTGQLATFFECCGEVGIVPIAGLEVTTSEEIHVLALFQTREQAESLAAELFVGIEPVFHDPEVYGDQPIVDRNDTIVRMIDRFLGTPTRFSLSDLGEEIHARDGLYIPAHVDRSMYSVSSQLGFLPDGNYDAAEVLRPGGTGSDLVPDRLPIICSSDAHFPEAIARRHITFEDDHAGFDSLKSALQTGRVTLHPAGSG